MTVAGRILADDPSISADQMRLVLDVSSLLAMTADLDALLSRIASAATELVLAERASIFLYDHRTNELWTKVAMGVREIRVPAAAGIVGAVFKSNQTLLVGDPYNDPRFNRDVDKRTGFVTRNLLTVPVKDLDRRSIGVLQVVNRIGGAFGPTDIALIELLADQAGVAIQRYRLQLEAVRGAALEHEMQLAHKVQAEMIPTIAPHIPGLRAVGWAKPASITGGDAYDLWKMDDGRLGIFLGDASGHGIGPALVVSQARTLIRALSEINCDPTWLLTRVNARLSSDLEAGRFVTAFMGCMGADGILNWCSAGHGPMFLRQHPDAPIEIVEPVAPPIGVLPDLDADIARPFGVDIGGTFIVMSDGVFEARGADDNVLFDVSRVVEVLDEYRHRTPEATIDALKKTVRQWQGGEEPADDQTVVIIQRIPM